MTISQAIKAVLDQGYTLLAMRMAYAACDSTTDGMPRDCVMTFHFPDKSFLSVDLVCP